MSRCFPFPPPGYEFKKTDQVDLVQKEKHKEKKHKKKDKEKRVAEEKDKDKRKDKHGEKKERKEKHTDKKRDKDKIRISDDRRVEDDRRTERRTEGRNAEKLGESGRKAEEVKDCRFAEEFGRRIKNEEKVAAHRMVENFTGSSQRTAEDFCTAIANEEGRSNGNEMVAEEFGGRIKNEEKVAAHRITENFTGSIQRTTEGFGTAIANEKAWTNGNKMVAEEFSRRIKNEEKVAEVRMPENFTGTIRRTTECLGAAFANEKDKTNGSGMVGAFVSREQKKIVGMGQPVDTGADRNIEKKQKAAKGEETDDRKKDTHKDRDREENKTKKKDNDRHKEKEKEKEKMREKGDHKHKKSNINKESGKKDLVDTQLFKPLVPHKDSEKCINADGNMKKRKGFEMNGFFHENAARHNKVPKPGSPPHPHVENGTLGSCHIADTYSSIGHAAKSNMKAPGVPNNREHMANGITGQPSSVDPMPLPGARTRQNGEASLKPPHPDSKYLDQIYAVPKMEEWPEFDGQEWLFNSHKSLPKPKVGLEDEETPQVWAKALQVEPGDDFALPYVIPY